MSNLHKYLNVYEFETTLPGSGKIVNYKGLTTNSIKKLLVYQEEDDPMKEEEILDSIINLSVIDKDFNIDELYVLDRYYLFIKIREATKGSIFQFQYNCPDCKSQTLQSIDLNDLVVKKPDNIVKEIKLLNDNIVFEVDFPKRSKQREVFNTIDKSLSSEEKKVEMGLAEIVSHINKINSPDGEIKIDHKELINFIGDLPANELDIINEWKEKNEFGIKLTYTAKCKCGHEKEMPLQLTNFFS